MVAMVRLPQVLTNTAEKWSIAWTRVYRKGGFFARKRREYGSTFSFLCSCSSGHLVRQDDDVLQSVYLRTLRGASSSSLVQGNCSEVGTVMYTGTSKLDANGRAATRSE
jgi:hypothetical protein